MGLLSILSDTTDFLFGKDSEQTTDVSGKVVTNQSKDSGQTTVTDILNSGSVDTTNTSSKSSTSNSGSQNVIKVGPSSSTTSTSDQINTSQVLLSAEAVNRLVQGILEGTNGLAAVSAGQKGAGGYNSTTNALLTNDLLARTAGEVAVRGAQTRTVIGGTTSTTANSGNTTTQDIGGSISTTATDNTATTIKGPSTSKNTATTGPRSLEEILTTSPTSVDVNNDSKGLLDRWIICTELHKQGRMPRRLYVKGAAKFATYSEEILRGYYFWAERSTLHLRAYPNSTYSNFLEHIFNQRAADIAGEGNLYSRIISGAVFAFCWTLSKTVARNHNYNHLAIYLESKEV